MHWNLRQTFNPNFSKAALITSVTVVCAVTGIILNVPAALYQVCYQMVILPHVVVKVRGENAILSKNNTCGLSISWQNRGCRHRIFSERDVPKLTM